MMNDDLQNATNSSDENSPPDKHEEARRLAEAAVAAQSHGEDERADALIMRASKSDPDAVAEVLAEATPHTEAVPPTDSDDEVAAVSRTLEPGAAAPSRANITGSGSGADNA